MKKAEEKDQIEKHFNEIWRMWKFLGMARGAGFPTVLAQDPPIVNVFQRSIALRGRSHQRHGW